MTFHRTIAIAAALLCGIAVQAQPKSAGVILSPQRFGAGYQHYLHDDVFWNLDIALEYGGCVLKQVNAPGVSISFGYNFVLWDSEYNSGKARVYAGPGVGAGYLPDKGHGMGPSIGIIGNLGYEYDFWETATLSVSIAPTLGFHLHNTDHGMQMDFYRNGLLLSLVPQVGIRYRFGEDRHVTSVLRHSRKDDRKAPRVTFGVEWSYIATLNSTFHHNYRAVEGFRVNEKGSRMMFMSNGALLCHGGVNFGRHYNLSLYAGYGGIYRGYDLFPLSLRSTWLFGSNPSASRWLCYIDGGVGLRANETTHAIIGKAGWGYRLSLSRSVKVDFLLSYQLSYASVPFSDSEGPVEANRIRKNSNYLSAINLGIGLTL